MEYNTLISLFDYALQMLYEKDLDLFIIYAQERTFAGRLAIYLQQAYDPNFQKDFRIDIEYNREGYGSKYRHPRVKRGWIAPDIVLHRRNNPENIFCCEMKLDEDEFNEDSIRIRDAVNERTYQFSVNLYLVHPEAAELSVFTAKDMFVKEEKYRFLLFDRKLVYRDQQRDWCFENDAWRYTE